MDPFVKKSKLNDDDLKFNQVTKYYNFDIKINIYIYTNHKKLKFIALSLSRV